MTRLKSPHDCDGTWWLPPLLLHSSLREVFLPHRVQACAVPSLCGQREGQARFGRLWSSRVRAKRDALVLL